MGVSTGKISFPGVDSSGLPAVVDISVSAGSLQQGATAWTLTEVDLSTDADVVLTASPAVVGNMWVTTVLSNHVATIQDATAVRYTFPAQSAAGTIFTNLNNSAFLTNITFVSENAMTGKLMVQWKAA